MHFSFYRLVQRNILSRKHILEMARTKTVNSITVECSERSLPPVPFLFTDENQFEYTMKISFFGKKAFSFLGNVPLLRPFIAFKTHIKMILFFESL